MMAWFSEKGAREQLARHAIWRSGGVRAGTGAETRLSSPAGADTTLSSAASMVAINVHTSSIAQLRFL